MKSVDRHEEKTALWRTSTGTFAFLVGAIVCVLCAVFSVAPLFAVGMLSNLRVFSTLVVLVYFAVWGGLVGCFSLASSPASIKIVRTLVLINSFIIVPLALLQDLPSVVPFFATYLIVSVISSLVFWGVVTLPPKCGPVT